MRSRTSRGVPEWFEGKDLYIGSPVSATGRVSGVTGIVPGPPEGSRGSTGWVHQSRRAPWAEVGGEQAPGGLVCPPLAPPAPRVGNPRGGGASTCLGGQGTPLGRRPPRRSHLLGPAPPLGGLYKGRGEGGSRTLSLGASLSPAAPLPLIVERRGPAAVTPASTTTPSCRWIFINLSFPPCWIKKEETSC